MQNNELKKTSAEKKGVNFLRECTRCGHKCCQKTPFFYKIDIDLIKKKYNNLQFEKKAKNIYILKGHKSSPCFFFDNGMCRLQEIKPLNCVAFPLIYKIIKNKSQIKWHLDKKCPAAPKVSKKFIDEGIKIYLKEIKKFASISRHDSTKPI